MQAGQVALEFLRARPSTDVDATVKNHNRIFKGVYEGMTDALKPAEHREVIGSVITV